MNKILIVIISLFSVLLITGCTSQENITPTQKNIDLTENSFWQTAELIDINTQETYKISDFTKPVLIESFAVWCPSCTEQQRQIKELHKVMGDTIISISLDTDPNEDEEKILEHTKKNDFDWRYSIPEIEITKSIIDDFSISFVNAPSIPMILVCPNGTTKFLKRGIKQASFLEQEINEVCSL